MNTNIAVNVFIIDDDYNFAIDESSKLANRLEINILLNYKNQYYKNQYQFLIKPNMSFDELEELKNVLMVIAL